MVISDWRYVTLGEIADALAAYACHPIRTIRAKARERRNRKEWDAAFNAEVEAYMAANPGINYQWAEMTVAQHRVNMGHAQMLTAMAASPSRPTMYVS